MVVWGACWRAFMGSRYTVGYCCKIRDRFGVGVVWYRFRSCRYGSYLCFYDFTIGFWNCSDVVFYFVFHFIILTISNIKEMKITKFKLLNDVFAMNIRSYMFHGLHSISRLHNTSFQHVKDYCKYWGLHSSLDGR